MDPKAMYKITYGLYLLTAQKDGRDNGCIINTVMQVAENPVRVAISVQKKTLTHDMIQSSGGFTVSALSTEANFQLFHRFGMQTGRTTDKFADFPYVTPAENGLLRLTKFSNMYLTAKVLEQVNLGTHSLFIAAVEEARSLSDSDPCTYSYYQAHIKPRPDTTPKGKKWVCDVCGWVYNEADTGIPWEALPDNFVCPLCKHGKGDFSPIA